MVLPPSLAFLASLPTPSHTNLADIKGNTSDEEKLIGAKAFWAFLCAGEFALDIGKHLKIIAISLDDEAHQCEVIHEIEVTKGVHT